MRRRRSVRVDDGVWDAAKAYVRGHPEVPDLGRLVEDALRTHLFDRAGRRRLKAVRRTQVEALERTVGRLTAALDEAQATLAEAHAALRAQRMTGSPRSLPEP